MVKSGGAGKVYFILYLAVVLELLIIIVERDEAEESLRRKQEETMRIVESILSQLQSGAGTEGINTKPQDEITIPPTNIDMEKVIGAKMKSNRIYSVEVGVTDVSTAIKKKQGETEKEYVQRLKKLVELGNVEELEYSVFFNDSEDPTNPPPFPSDDWLKKNDINLKNFEPGQILEGPEGVQWEFLALRELNLDKEATFNKLNLEKVTVEAMHPVYPSEDEVIIGPTYAPDDVPSDSVFYYSSKESLEKIAIASDAEMQKRTFKLNFQPPSQAGWYKLRVHTRTNRILGVRMDVPPDQVDDETTVNIGTVQLTVEDLRKVKKELLRNLEKYDLPELSILESGDDPVDEFDRRLQESKKLAQQEDDAVELIGKINLYGYISKLLAPGMSITFDQNRGAIAFDVRVITPKPKIANPTVKLPEYTGSFDAVAPVFEFPISPYQGEGTNQLEGFVYDQVNGNTVARLKFVALDQLADMNLSDPTQGGQRMYRGFVDEPLPPGKYKIEVIHKLMGKESKDEAVLEIFKTSLTEESETLITQRLNAFAFYGYKIVFDAVATSGGKIKSNQFRTYLTTDVQEQKPPIEGLNISQDQALELPANADKVILRISWIQPYTNKEVDLFPRQEFDIKQESPEVITRNLRSEISGTATKIKVRVNGIVVTQPPAGPGGEKAEVEVEVGGQPTKIEGLKTYDFSIEPSIEGDAQSGYSLYLEMEGKLPPREDRIKGSISIPVAAVAVNPINDKASERNTTPIVVNINYEPERGARRRRR